MMHNLYIEYTFLSNMYVHINVQEVSYFIFPKKRTGEEMRTGNRSNRIKE